MSRCSSQEPPAALEDMSRDQLYRVINTARLDANTQAARAEEAEKRATLADRTNAPRGRGRPPNRARRGRHGPQADSENEDENDRESASASEKEEDPQDAVRSAGYKHGLINQIWVTKAISKTFKLDLSADYNKAHRFDKIANKVQGELREAHNLLPADYRGRVQRKKQWVAYEFNYGFKHQRWDTASRIRRSLDGVWKHHLGDAIGNVADMRDSRARAGWAERIGGHDDEAGKKVYEIFDAPILHSDDASSFDANTFLYHPLLMHIAMATLFGPAKAENAATGKGQVAKGRCMAEIHDVRRTTPGIIANAAVYTLWALSADMALTEQGTQTGINYQAAHNDFLEYLLTGLRERRECIIKLFRAWDDVLFPDTEEASVGAARGMEPAAGAGRRKALAALSAMDVVEEEENEPSGGDEQENQTPVDAD
ncbi:hypothetical protein C8F01DRAFT_1268518 [Mycena amicta]|nr:hypothetical protein C8F01DRAFT_1268518 [Mycena amicta]